MIPYSELLSAKVPAAEHRIAYGSEPLQFGELRLPPGDAKVPLIVLIHGGCWLSAYNLDHTRGAAHALVREGYAVWSPEYRRVGDAGGGWPGTFDDVASAVDHVRIVAREHPRLDTSRVILMGHSAGGHLALWAASRPQVENNGLAPSNPIHVVGVVGLAAISDIAEYGSKPGSCSGAVTPLVGGTPLEQPARYLAVNPTQRAPVSARVILVHGENDPIVPLSQSQNFAAKQSASGGQVRIDVVNGAGHFDVVAPQSEAWPSVVRAVRSLLPL